MKTAQQIAADCGIVGDDCDRLSAMLEDRYPSECDQQAAEIMKLLVKRIEKLEEERSEFRPMSYACEDVFIVSQTVNGGKWNKLVKSQERWWYSEGEAQGWLDAQEDWFKASNKVFKVRMAFHNIERTKVE